MQNGARRPGVQQQRVSATRWSFLAENGLDGDGTPVAVSAELDLAALHTGNGRRDKDLRARRFFDTANHPRMRFESSSLEARDEGWDVVGTLTIARTACPLTLHVPPGDDDDRDGFVTAVSLDPRDLGVTAPRVLIRKVVTLHVSAHLVGTT